MMIEFHLTRKFSSGFLLKSQKWKSQNISSSGKEICSKDFKDECHKKSHHKLIFIFQKKLRILSMPQKLTLRIIKLSFRTYTIVYTYIGVKYVWTYDMISPDIQCRDTILYALDIRYLELWHHLSQHTLVSFVPTYSYLIIHIGFWQYIKN